MPARRGFARHLEGWELGSLTLALVVTAALLAVPRAVEPGLFPVPPIDVFEARATRERLAELAARAEQRSLPFEARAVGDGFRKLGLALAAPAADVGHALEVLHERVEIARRAGQDPALLELRAVQARLFVRALRAEEREPAREPSAELRALGGDFLKRAATNGWLSRRRCRASDDELYTLFTLRWTELTRLRDAPGFAPTLGDLRRYYRFLLLYPERSAEPGAEAGELARARLRYVEALGRKDPDYPAALARGALLGQLGQVEPGAAALREHLAGRAGGVWALRARNYLLGQAAATFADEAP